MYNLESNSFVDLGQKFYIINQDIWELLKEEKELEGVCVKSSFIISTNQCLDFVERHEGFCCAITKCAYHGTNISWEIWEDRLFYKIANEWVRVSIEGSHCSECKWKGRIAGIEDVYIYEGTTGGKYAQVKEAIKRNLPRLKCPCCDSELARYPVWIEKEAIVSEWIPITQTRPVCFQCNWRGYLSEKNIMTSTDCPNCGKPLERFSVLMQKSKWMEKYLKD